jgi:hypothetical protein
MGKRIQSPRAAQSGGIHAKRYRGAARRSGKSERSDGTRIVTVRLSEFARKALFGEREQGSERVETRVVRAIRCYLKDKGKGGPGWAYPGFLRQKAPSEGVELELSIEDSLWASLEQEAKSQSISVRQMLEHAVLYFAAEVNAGRLTERILDDFDEAEGKPA